MPEPFIDGNNSSEFWILPCNNFWPIIQTSYKDMGILNPLLEKAIRKRGDIQEKKTNVKADMTEWDMRKEEGGEHFETLCEWILKVVKRDTLKTTVPLAKPLMTHVWGNVYKKGHLTIKHCHIPATWSFVYFVNVSPHCSPLVFPDANFSVDPKDGKLVLFPSWFSHSVPEQTADYERVAIAGNIMALNPDEVDEQE